MSSDEQHDSIDGAQNGGLTVEYIRTERDCIVKFISSLTIGMRDGLFDADMEGEIRAMYADIKPLIEATESKQSDLGDEDKQKKKEKSRV